MADTKQTMINLVGTDRETIISIILGAIVVIVIGALAFRYFRGNNAAVEATPTPGIENQQVVEVEELPQGEVMTEETTEGQIPTNLPAKYTVKEGDSTWKIAEAFYGSGFNYVDIETANGLTPEQGLTAGMSLTIPRVPVRTADSAAAPQGDIQTEEGTMPTEQTTGPTKGDDSAAQAVMNQE